MDDLSERPGTDDEDRIPGRYANSFAVGYNAFEFILDFGQSYSETGTSQVHTRIITNPRDAEALLDTLKESLGQYEQKFGAIRKNG